VRRGSRAAALPWIAWSRVFSPLTPGAWRDESWRALEIPSTWAESSVDFWSVFQAGVPSPTVPLLLHTALGRDGSAVREDWMRVMAHLGLSPAETTLPPDHLGPACEILACAVEQEEAVLVRELCSRYLRPWSAVAHRRLAGRGAGVGGIGDRFAFYLDRCAAGGLAPPLD